MNYDSPKELREALAQSGLTLKKRFGQNFLTSRGAREKMLQAVDPKPTEALWEIGPGLGSMTHLLLPLVKSVTAFEIDHGFVRYLEGTFGLGQVLRIVAGDFIATWPGEAKTRGMPDVIVGNLPYSSAAAIVAALVESNEPKVRMVITVQREVARRMSAAAGSADYSSFSVMCQSAYTVDLRGDLKPHSFYPAPNVVSSIVTLTPHDRFEIADRQTFHRIVRWLFGARRKTLRNNLAADALQPAGDREWLRASLEASGIDLGLRAERLRVEQLVDVANRFIASRRFQAP